VLPVEPLLSLDLVQHGEPDPVEVTCEGLVLDAKGTRSGPEPTGVVIGKDAAGVVAQAGEVAGPVVGGEAEESSGGKVGGGVATGAELVPEGAEESGDFGAAGGQGRQGERVDAGKVAVQEAAGMPLGRGVEDDPEVAPRPEQLGGARGWEPGEAVEVHVQGRVFKVRDRAVGLHERARPVRGLVNGAGQPLAFGAARAEQEERRPGGDHGQGVVDRGVRVEPEVPRDARP
jgi:hypothetical protein